MFHHSVPEIKKDNNHQRDFVNLKINIDIIVVDLQVYCTLCSYLPVKLNGNIVIFHSLRMCVVIYVWIKALRHTHDGCNDDIVHGEVFHFLGNECDPYGSLTTRRGDYVSVNHR